MSPVNVSSIGQVRIGLASANDIKDWSSGEVTKPETVNYRSNKPEKDGLFCEKIFGPTKAWECACGKYKRVHVKGLVCERCKVEVTSDKVRRERMGHIQLQTPVVHIWYLRGTKSWLTYLLSGVEVKEELKAKQLEKVVYYSARLVTRLDEAGRDANLSILQDALNDEVVDIEEHLVRTLERLERDFNARMEYLRSEANTRDTEIRAAQKEYDERCTQARDSAQLNIDRARQAFETFSNLHLRQVIEDELLYREMELRYSEYFEGGMGAEAILQLIDSMDLDEEERIMLNLLNGKAGKVNKTRADRLLKRLRIVQALNHRDANGERFNDPTAMILTRIPVIPPDLRPMVQLDGGRQATSDLNDLYRHVINRNNRLRKLLENDSPEIIVNNERRMLQEAVDALIDNGKHGRAAAGPSGRPAKSLTDVLKGKQGRFRQNLLGKRVDYSARSAIVVGPTLKLHQCGLPKIMALELFKPFVIRALMADGTAQNIRSAKRMVEQRHVLVWEKLEAVTREHPVLLNRAPTLHRLGVQAFEPVLVDGKAIQIHPLVCKAFNADFDGDTMSVHVPLSAEAQAEARVLMLSVNNIFTPATGRAITEPSQDMVLGLYYLTRDAKEVPETPRVFRRVHEIEAALDRGLINLHTQIVVRTDEDANDSTLAQRLAAAGVPAVNGRRSLETTAGRVIFNEALPAGYRFVNVQVGKNAMPVGSVVEEIANSFTRKQVAEALDAIKDLGFRFASQSGTSIGFDDIVTSPQKAEIMDRYEKDAEKVELNFRRGVVIDEERRQNQIDIWTRANRELGDVCYKALDAQTDNPIRMMVDSGARGNRTQILQITAMKGLVVNSRGELEHRPAKSSFREGLTSWEYFVSLHGTRKGLADTALRTADSGYLTRRLVDVAQELIIKEHDCGTTRGLVLDHVAADTAAQRAFLETKLWGRVLAADVTLSDGTVFPAGHLVSVDDVETLRDDAAVTSVRVRSTLVCEAEHGVCATCYGMSLATHKLVEAGEAVGVIAAQSIGEPGTQLTMRTFHSGGVSGRDITHGLPRVNELFEARTPKGAAAVSKNDGTVQIERPEGAAANARWRVSIVSRPDDKGEVHVQEESLPARTLIVKDGDTVEAGQPLNRGPLDPKTLMELRGTRETQRYLVEEMQAVYRDQGVSIHDKHIELVVRQMTDMIQVVEKHRSPFLPQELVEARVFNAANDTLASVEGSSAAATALATLKDFEKKNFAGLTEAVTAALREQLVIEHSLRQRLAETHGNSEAHKRPRLAPCDLDFDASLAAAGHDAALKAEVVVVEVARRVRQKEKIREALDVDVDTFLRGTTCEDALRLRDEVAYLTRVLTELDENLAAIGLEAGSDDIKKDSSARALVHALVKKLEDHSNFAAVGRAMLLGVTKASLATDSWLAAASFQETTRVLTEAAVAGRRDDLKGLKENIVLGKLIPAGLGLPAYAGSHIGLDMPNAELLPEWAIRPAHEDGDLADILGELPDSMGSNVDEELASFLAMRSATDEGVDLDTAIGEPSADELRALEVDPEIDLGEASEG